MKFRNLDEFLAFELIWKKEKQSGTSGPMLAHYLNFCRPAARSAGQDKSRALGRPGGAMPWTEWRSGAHRLPATAGDGERRSGEERRGKRLGDSPRMGCGGGGSSGWLLTLVTGVAQGRRRAPRG
jgi:hypothetical protein